MHTFGRAGVVLDGVQFAFDAYKSGLLIDVDFFVTMLRCLMPRAGLGLPTPQGCLRPLYTRSAHESQRVFCF